MDEKTMVNDVMSDIKKTLNNYEQVIAETENIQVRQTLQSIRNNNESFQYELFRVAQVKGYYVPSEEATIIEIQNMKKELQN